MTAPVALWDGPPPGSESWSHVEQYLPDDYFFASGGVRNVTVPTLTPYMPPQPTSQAVLLVPGGGFHVVSLLSEGHQVATVLNAAGIAAFVLKYRVVPTPPDEKGFEAAFFGAFGDMEGAMADYVPLAVADAARALELIRSQSFEHVSLLGFSAGGRIAADIVTSSDRGGRPDSAGVVYAPTVGTGTAAPEDAPPLFVLAAADDPLGIDGSLDLHTAWRAAGHPIELHLYERGGHGFGLGQPGSPVHGWIDLYVTWLRTQCS